jgi:hypothetical protein
VLLLTGVTAGAVLLPPGVPPLLLLLLPITGVPVPGDGDAGTALSGAVVGAGVTGGGAATGPPADPVNGSSALLHLQPASSSKHRKCNVNI